MIATPAPNRTPVAVFTRSSSQPWATLAWHLLLAALTLATFLIHGYHPYSEDGGLYLAGIEWKLNPALFPHYNAFVREHLRYSLFAPLVASIVRVTHLSLPVVLLLLDLSCIWLTLYAALLILRRCIASPLAQLGGLSLLSVWWTLPVAATSLSINDPSVTARTLSLPLSLLAIAFALDKPTRRSSFLAFTLIALGASVHALMAGYALALILVLRFVDSRKLLTALAFVTLIAASALQLTAPPESPAFLAAELTRYYWFLSQWHWYEYLGLLGPILIFTLLQRSPRLTPEAQRLLRACITLCIAATVISLLFAREDLATHRVASLQPLRAFVIPYALMALLLGAHLTQLCLDSRHRLIHKLPAAILLTLAAAMFFVQRSTFPASPHIELPGRSNTNPWVQAFLWSRDSTPADALFALDARYINTDGEDAQTFRAIAQRSALPDYSKDGGEASLMPALAADWQRAALTQRDLATQPDAQRTATLRSIGATWLILPTKLPTAQPCPYSNNTIKVCRLSLP